MRSSLETAQPQHAVDGLGAVEAGGGLALRYAVVDLRREIDVDLGRGGGRDRRRQHHQGAGERARQQPCRHGVAVKALCVVA